MVNRIRLIPKTTYLLFFGLLIIFYLLNWNSLNAPFERDEGEYAYSARIMQNGETPYQDTFLQKPPLIVYTYALGQRINADAVWPPRLLAIGFAFLTTIVIGLIAKHEWGENAGWISMYLYSFMHLFPVLTPFSANTEKFMLLPLMSIVYLYIRFRDHPADWVLVLSGLSAALAVMYKPIAMLVIGLIYLIWFYQMYRTNQRQQLRLIKKGVVLISAGLVTAIVVMLPIILRGGLADFWQQVVVFNRAYAATFGWGFENILNYLGKFFHYWWILMIPLVLYLTLKPKHWRFYLALLSVGGLTIYTSPMGHYYLLIVPFLTLMVAAGIAKFTTRLKPNYRTLFPAIANLILMVTMFAPFYPQLSYTPTELSTWVYGTVNPFAEAPVVAEKVSAMTNAADRIFVAGSEPEIYYYANRRASTKFVITYPLNLPTDFREKFQAAAVNDLKNNPPAVIVMSNRAHSGFWNEGSPTIFIDYLSHLIETEYVRVGGYVWDNLGNDWLDNIEDTQIDKASFVVYQLK